MNTKKHIMETKIFREIKIFQRLTHIAPNIVLMNPKDVDTAIRGYQGNLNMTINPIKYFGLGVIRSRDIEEGEIKVLADINAFSR